MPKGMSTPGASSSARQETDDGEARALASVAEGWNAWNEELIRDHMDWVIEDISDIAVLSPMACLIF